jgi:hypothetical protein
MRARKPPILVGAPGGRAGLLANPHSVRGWPEYRLAVFSLVAALFMVVSVPTTISFTVVRDLVPVGQGVYVSNPAHQSKESLGQVRDGDGGPVSPETHRTRGVVDNKNTTDSILASIVSVEDYHPLAENTQTTPRPAFDEPSPTGHSLPQELLERPPPVS